MQILGLYIARPVFTRTLCLCHDLAHVLVTLFQNNFSTTPRQKQKTKNFSTSKCNVYQAYHSPDWTKFAVSTQSPSFFGGANAFFLKKNLASHYMHKKKIIAENMYNVFATKRYSSDTRKNEKSHWNLKVAANQEPVCLSSGSSSASRFRTGEAGAAPNGGRLHEESSCRWAPA